MRAADLAVITSVGGDDIPLNTAEALIGNRGVLVLAPHPDDESLACGALLASAFAMPGPKKAHVVCLTDGAASHPGSREVSAADLAILRRQELQMAVLYLGGTAGDVTWLGAPDGSLVAASEMVDRIVAIARDCDAGLVLAPSPLDPHCDHVAGATIGRAVAAQMPGVRLGYYPVWSRWHGGGTAPVPDRTYAVGLRAGPHAARKAAAIAAHASQQGGVVRDAPDGFEMPPGFADFFAKQDEIYFLDQPGDQP